jgi:hypothetical protein
MTVEFLNCGHARLTRLGFAVEKVGGCKSLIRLTRNHCAEHRTPDSASLTGCGRPFRHFQLAGRCFNVSQFGYLHSADCCLRRSDCRTEVGVSDVGGRVLHGRLRRRAGSSVAGGVRQSTVASERASCIQPGIGLMSDLQPYCQRSFARLRRLRKAVALTLSLQTEQIPVNQRNDVIGMCSLPYFQRTLRRLG